MEYNKIIYGEIKFVPHNISNHIKSSHHETNGLPTIKNTDALSFKAPTQQLCDPSLVKLDWLQSEKIGGGLINVGNTCFLNSVLQCLTYCPPLYNYLIKYNGGHSHACKLNQFCMLCEMEKHIKRIKNSNGIPIKPISIVHRLKYINRNFQFGRQEDAHEFLRYLIDHMWKACLMNLDINVKNNNNGDKIDPRVKETTAINHIFGGYHRSQVLCLNCNSRSNTFDFFMDFILDIRNAKSLEDSLRKFTQPETLEHENAYKCSRCKRKVTAKKRFSVYKAPNVATFQLKRFDSDRINGGKVNKYVSYPEELDLRPYMSDSSKSPIRYQLCAVLVHVGQSCNSGHYFCYIKNSNGCWYRMDDSSVTISNKSVVLQQQAYILFYTKKSKDAEQQTNGTDKVKASNINKDAVYSNSNSSNNKATDIPGKILVNNSNQSDGGGAHNLSNSENNSTDCRPRINSDGSSATSPSKRINGNSQSSTSPVKQYEESENNKRASPVRFTSLSTWLGVKSKLDDEGSTKRKNEDIDRDKFNEELDQGKKKKIKSQNRDDKFNHLAKFNPFQGFNSSNGYNKLLDTSRHKHHNRLHDKNRYRYHNRFNGTNRRR